MANSKWKQLVYGSVIQDNRTYPPTVGKAAVGFSAPAGSASIAADAAITYSGQAYAEGDVLFYTDGSTVYDSAGNIMNGGGPSGLGGENKHPQSVVITPSTEANYFWIFANMRTHITLSYVDMTGNSGRGTVTQNVASGKITPPGAITGRMAAYYDTTTSDYGIIAKREGAKGWDVFLTTGHHASHYPTYAATVTTAVGSVYNSNDAANRSCVKFNADGSKFATVYQADVGTSGSPVTTALVEVYDFNTNTGAVSNFQSFTIDIKDAGAITAGGGHDQRLTAYDLEWDYTSNTLYVPTYDSLTGMGISWYTLNASNVVTAQGTVSGSFKGIGKWGDRVILGMYKDPVDDIIYVATPNVIASTGGYSANYNDQYATNQISAITSTSTPSTSTYIDSLSTTSAGLIGAGLPNRPLAGEDAGPSSYYTLTPCDAQKEYVMDADGIIWLLDGSLDATQIADVSSIANRKNIAVQKETNFIYLLAGTGTSCAIYKIDPVTGSTDSGIALSDAGSSITSYDLIAGKDATATDFIAMINTSGGHKYATIVIATGVTTPAGSAQAGITPLGMAVLGTNYFVTHLKRVYKNAAGTWSLLAATNTGLADSIKGLATDDTTLYGYVDGKRYTINQSTGEATLAIDITINESSASWNHEVNGAGIVNAATLTTNVTTPGSHLNKIITVQNFGGCYTVTTAVSGSAAIGTILTSSDTCGECADWLDEDNCTVFYDCCIGKSDTAMQQIVATTNDVVDFSKTYQLTGGTTTDQLNRCVTPAIISNDSMYMTFSNGQYGHINLGTGKVTLYDGAGGNGMTFDKNANPINISSSGSISALFSGAISVTTLPIIPPASNFLATDQNADIVVGGTDGGVTKIARGRYDYSNNSIALGEVINNSNVKVTGDLTVSKAGLYYCIGDMSPGATPETNDLFTLASATLTNTDVASLTSTLGLNSTQICKGLAFIDDVLKVLVWDAKTSALALYEVTPTTGNKVSTLSLQTINGETEFHIPPTSLAARNTCQYHTPSSFTKVSYNTCSDCFDSTTAKQCVYELTNCVNSVIKYTTVNLSSDLNKVISINEPGLYNCYTVKNYYTAVDSDTYPDVTKLESYDDCDACTNSETSIYQVVKCSDATDDPKYTTADLTPGIDTHLNAVVVLEGEYFGRSVITGDSSHSLLITALTISSSAADCGSAKFFTRLTACGDPTRTIDIDYESSTGVQAFVGTTKAISINNLGNNEDQVCWTVADWVQGPGTHQYTTVAYHGSADDCLTCGANALVVAPVQVYLESCCAGPAQPLVQYYYQVGGGMDITIEDAGQIVEADIFDPDTGQTYSGCWTVTSPEFGVAPGDLSDWTNITVYASEELGNSPGTTCQDCVYTCDSQDGCQLIPCDVSAPNYFIDCAEAPESYINNVLVYTGHPDLKGHCFKLCYKKFDGIHGVNWFWGIGAGLKFEFLDLPYAQYDGNTSMSVGNSFSEGYTKFQSAVHSVGEDITIGTRDYAKGDILFYTDGKYCYNADHTIIPLTNTWQGGEQMLPTSDINNNFTICTHASQQAVIVPDPTGGFIGDSGVHMYYYVFFQTAGDGPMKYSRIMFDAGNETGTGTPDAVNVTVTEQSTERLCVSSIPEDGSDVYWVLDVEPYAAPITPLSPATWGKIRAHRVSSSGLEIDYAITTLIPNPTMGQLNDFPQMSSSAKIKLSPDNRWVIVTGWQSGRNWNVIGRFNSTTGDVTIIDIWTDVDALPCVPTTSGNPNSNCNANISTDFIPRVTAVEFDASSKYLYVLKSGSNYPPDAPSGTCPDDPYYASTKLLRRELNAENNTVEPYEDVESFIEYLPGPDGSTATQQTAGNVDCPTGHSSMPTDMILGPDWNIYFGLYRDVVIGSSNNGLGRWRQQMPGIGLIPPNPNSDSYTQYIGRIVAPHTDEPIVQGNQNTGENYNTGLWSQTYCDLANRQIGPGFPTYLRKMCPLPTNDDEIITGIAISQSHEACGASTDCGVTTPTTPGYKICECSCSGGDGVGCDDVTDACYSCDKDYTMQLTGTDPGIPGMGDGANTIANPTAGNPKYSTVGAIGGEDVRHWTAIRQAVENLQFGDQTVIMSYSFVNPACTYQGQNCDPFSQGYGVRDSSLCAGDAFDFNYKITKANFKGEIDFCFEKIKELFEATFNKSCGYGGNLCLNFVRTNAPGLAPGNVDIGDEVWDGVTGTGEVVSGALCTNVAGSLQGTPYTDATSGISNIGDFRIAMTQIDSSGWAGGYLGYCVTNSPEHFLGEQRLNTTSSTIVLDTNDEWRMRSQTFMSGPGGCIDNSGNEKAFEIVRIMTHEILHGMGVGHCWKTFYTWGTQSGYTCADVLTSPCTAPLIQREGACSNGLWAYRCGIKEFGSIMAATANAGMEWNLNFGLPSCDLAGYGGEIDRASLCSIYSYTYGNSPYTEPALGTNNRGTPNLVRNAMGADNDGMPSDEYDFLPCNDCEGSCFYSENVDLEQYVNGPSFAFKWDPGDGLGERCFQVEAVDEIPIGETLVNVPDTVDSFADCEECIEETLQPSCWKLVKCACSSGAGTGPQIITTSTDMSDYCTIGGEDGPNVDTPVVQLAEYPNICYTIDCDGSQELTDQECALAVAVTVTIQHSDCTTCCGGDPGMCYNLTSCTTGETFVTFTDLSAYVGSTVSLSTYVTGMAAGDCFIVGECGPCGVAGTCVGFGAVVVANEYQTCNDCQSDGILVWDLFDCNTCFDPENPLDQSYPNPIPSNCIYLLGVSGGPGIAAIFAAGQSCYTEIDWTDIYDNYCFKPFPSTLDPTLTTAEATSACICLVPPAPDVIGCMDVTAMNYVPNATIPCDGSNGDPIIPCIDDQTLVTNPLGCCCNYGVGETPGCLDIMAINYCPGCTQDCAEVAGGTDYSCCTYPADPPVISVQYEQDCVNCHSWDEIDNIFQKTAKLCDECWPPAGLSFKEYYCEEELPTPPEPPEPPVIGCMDTEAWNYDPDAELPCAGCCAYLNGCTDQSACNYDPEAMESNIAVCVYPNECGSCTGNLDCIEPGCTNPAACNYCPSCVEDDGSCEYVSCVGCCDPADPNYCPTCTQCNNNYCISGIFDCLDNRNMYIFYDMTSMGFGYDGDTMQFVMELKQTFDGTLAFLEAAGYTGRVTHLPVRHASDQTCPSDANACGNSGLNSVHAPFTVGDANTERYLHWVTYPIRGNKGAFAGTLPETDRVIFHTMNVCGDTGLLGNAYVGGCEEMVQADGTPGAFFGYYESIYSHYSWDGISDFISTLPPQLDPGGLGASLGTGRDGLADPYHEFHPDEPGDTNAICICFIDESDNMGENWGVPQVAGQDVLDAISYHNALDSQSALCQQGDLNYVLGVGANTLPDDYRIGRHRHQTDEALNNISDTYANNFAVFDQLWSLGWDVDNMTYYDAPNADGYKQNNFNTLIIPCRANADLATGLTGSPLCFMHHLNQAIGKGIPTAEGHITVANFMEWPSYMGSNADSARYMTDPGFVNSYKGGQAGFPIGSEQNNLLGNYKFNYAVPYTATNLGQFSSDQMLWVLLEGLCAGYMTD
tara:strand:- start:37855 stop:48441 length:10587 start_codon:yes stop_codon:yes gene_type:complete